jgi:hypothetical protein
MDQLALQFLAKQGGPKAVLRRWPKVVKLICRARLLRAIKAVVARLGKQTPTVIRLQAADRSKDSQARLAKWVAAWVGLTPALFKRTPKALRSTWRKCGSVKWRCPVLP